MVVPATWVLWFALLAATPYYALKPYDGALYSGIYAYVALGSIAGAWASVKLPLYKGDRFVFAATGGLAIIGIAITLLFLGGEWAGLPLFLNGRLEESVALSFRWLMQFEQPCMLVAAFSCAFVGVHVVAGNMSQPIIAPTGFHADLERGSFPTALRMLMIACPIILFLLGLVRVVVWSPFLPLVIHAAPMPQVSLGAPAAFVFFPLSATFLLSLIIVRVIYLVPRKRPDGVEMRKPYGAILITAYCLGMLCWNMLTRIVAIAGTVLDDYRALVVAVDVAAVVLVVGVLWLTVKARAASQCSEASRDGLVKSENGSATALNDLSCAVFSECGLTEREHEAAILLLGGLTSTESAEKMGIRPSTVRAYLQRAYGKLGVANAEELSETVALRSLEATDPVDMSARKMECQQESPRRATLLAALLGGTLAAFVLLLVPYHYYGEAWGLGRELLVGGASAAVVASAAVMFVRWMALPDAGASHGGGPARRLLRSALLCALSVFSGLVLLYCLSRLSLGAYQRRLLSSLVFTCAAGLFFVSWGASAMKGLSAVRAYPGSLRATVLGAILIALACLSLASISWEMWAILALASLLTGSSIFFLAPSGLGEEAVHDQAFNAGLGGVGIWAFFALGFSAEELWRALSSFSLAEATIPYLAALTLAGAVFSLRAALSIRLASCIVAFASIGGAVAGGGHRALFMGAVVQMFVLVAYGVRRKAVTDGMLLRWSLSAGVGCLIGVVAVDMVSDVLLWGDVLLRPFGGRDPLSERVLIGAGVLFMALGAAAMLLCKRLHEEVQMRELSISWGTRMDERIRHYFLGAGLNETQALVLVEVVHGNPSSAISERLNYARGTVNSARDSAYRTLRVRSRAQLIALLKENAGL